MHGTNMKKEDKGLFKNVRTHLYSSKRSVAQCTNVMAFCWGNFWRSANAPKRIAIISWCVGYCRLTILPQMGTVVPYARLAHLKHKTCWLWFISKMLLIWLPH